ncbi:MAG: anaphase-promoting complex subunit cdc27 [Bathelium mastoideum]|nr:MAG: anaphase-promoting complex subunit cdc27 [Bathelium mastoideum]
MSPSTPYVASQLRQLIFYHLDNDFLENALFMAERLQALEPKSPDAAHLLSLCNLRLRRYKAAHEHSLKHGSLGKHLGCAYVFAQACLALKLYSEGIIALQKAKQGRSGESNWNRHSESARRHLPDGAAVSCLMAKLYRGRMDLDKATECFVEALKLNPFMWDAFTGLCDMGVSVQPANVFRLPPEVLAMLATQQQQQEGARQEDIPSQSGPLAHQSSNAHNQILTPSGDPFNPSIRTAGDPGPKPGGTSLFSKLNGSKMPAYSQDQRRPHREMNETPTAICRDDTDAMMGNIDPERFREPPDAPSRRARTLHEQRLDVSQDAGPQRVPSGRIRPQYESESSSGTHTIDSSKTLKLPNYNHKRTVSGHSAQSAHSTASAATDNPMAPQTRRSIRLLSQMRPSSNKSAASEGLFSKEGRELKKARSVGVKGKTAPTVGRVVSGNRKPMEKPDPNGKESRTIVNQPTHHLPQAAPAKPPLPEVPPSEEALHWLLDLFLKLANGYLSLSRHQCQAAIDHFNSVTQSQRETPWVLAQIGRALYESSSHREAAEVFSRLRKLAPSHVEDMEVYTTILWHLKSNVELAWLSRELLDTDSHSPQAWCAVGNSWSLEREHEQAITCFKRATQLDPNFAYAYTLEGHEHVESEEFEKATECYRTAIERDIRAYGAWYGLGRVNEKIGKYADAEKYYTMASKINGANALLVSSIGMVLEKQRKLSQALAQYDRATTLDPRSTSARFKKARALFHLHRPKDALCELQALKDLAPDDANVHFLLGKVYKALRERPSAIRHFTMAMNLDPKASPFIKEAMESIDDDEYDDDDLPGEGVEGGH